MCLRLVHFEGFPLLGRVRERDAPEHKLVLEPVGCVEEVDDIPALLGSKGGGAVGCEALTLLRALLLGHEVARNLLALANHGLCPLGGLVAIPVDEKLDDVLTNILGHVGQPNRQTRLRDRGLATDYVVLVLEKGFLQHLGRVRVHSGGRRGPGLELGYKLVGFLLAQRNLLLLAQSLELLQAQGRVVHCDSRHFFSSCKWKNILLSIQFFQRLERLLLLRVECLLLLRVERLLLLRVERLLLLRREPPSPSLWPCEVLGH